MLQKAIKCNESDIWLFNKELHRYLVNNVKRNTKTEVIGPFKRKLQP